MSTSRFVFGRGAMPYGKFNEGEEICVYKTNADGEKMGKAMGCHATDKEADTQIAALHANVKEQIAELQAELPAGAAVKKSKRRAADPTAGPVQEFCGSLGGKISPGR